MSNRKKELPPSSELLAEAIRLFSYDSATGNLIWVAPKDKRRPGQARMGDAVGGDDGNGYRMCALLGHKLKVHQVVWLMHHGEFPAMPIDHIDRDRRTNRIENLRLATDQQSAQNRKARTCQFSGVSEDRRCKSAFRARIVVDGKKKYLGYFKSREDASAAYVEASRLVKGEFSPV
jgi:hypothetical protein